MCLMCRTVKLVSLPAAILRSAFTSFHPPLSLWVEVKPKGKEKDVSKVPCVLTAHTRSMEIILDRLLVPSYGTTMKEYESQSPFTITKEFRLHTC